MDYTSKISLVCPSCGSSFFGETGSKFVCMQCNKTFTRNELEKSNEARINKQIRTVYEKQILPDLSKKLKSDLQKAFRGNPYIKIK